MRRAARRLFKSYVLVLFLCAAPFISASTVGLPSVPTASGKIVGINLQNPTASTVVAGPVQFGQAFIAGDLEGASGIEVAVNGDSVPAQIDVKTKHSDGSVKYGVVTVMAPALDPQSKNPTVLSSGSKTGSPLSLSSLSNYSFLLTLTIEGEGVRTFDVAKLFAQELSAGRVSYWREGPVVTEGRIDVPVTSSMRLVIDLSKYQDGSYSTDIQFNNDYAMTPVGGTITYSVVATQNGEIVSKHSNLTQYQYTGWREVFWTGEEPLVNVQRDIAYLKKAGVIHQYDLDTGVSSSLISDMEKAMAGESWGRPFDAAGITKYMGATGGRGDIGPTTLPNTVWLLTQDANAAAFALGQGEAAAGIPWHFWDKNNTTWLNTDNYPNLWTDYRGGTGVSGNKNSGGLTQQVAANVYDWQPDTAHQPSLSYIPYLLTGERFYLDQLNASGSFVEMSYWPSGPEYGHARNYGEGLVLSPANQVRGAAWSFRELVSAAWANPDGTEEKEYFTNMVENNLKWVIAQIPARTTAQGEVYGYHEGSYGTSWALPPWQQDYLMSSMALASQLGFRDANTFITWAENWSTGRFLNSSEGFNPRDGAAYLLALSASDGTRSAKTWKDLGKNTVEYLGSNGNAWGKTEGDYAQLALMALAGIANTIDSTKAKEAYAWLASVDAPYTDNDSYERGPTFNIIPRGKLPRAPKPEVVQEESEPDPESAEEDSEDEVVNHPKSPDGSTIRAKSSNILVTTDGVWSFDSKKVDGGYAINLNGVQAQNGGGTKLLVAKGGVMYAFNNKGVWYVWSNGSWSVAQDPTRSADGSTLVPGTTGSLLTQDGTWTFDSALSDGGNKVLRNGVQVQNGAAVKLLVAQGGKLYAFNDRGVWYLWSTDTWVVVSDPTKSSSSGSVLGADSESVTTPFSFTRDLAVGSTGEDVMRLQRALKSMGFFSEEVTGYYGPLTERAVSLFQESRGLEPVGIVGTRTQEILNWE